MRNVFDEEEFQQTLCSIPWTRGCMKCEKYFLTKRYFIKHYVVNHGAKCSWKCFKTFPWTVMCEKCEKLFFLKKEIKQTPRGSACVKFDVINQHKRIHVKWFHQKFNKFYTCKGRELKVNQRGHLTKHQEAVHGPECS